MANFDLKLIPEFDGTGDFVDWYEKVKLVCELQKPSVDLTAVVPLRLTGGAAAVYRQLSTEVKAEADEVKKALQRAFAVDKFAAYEQFRVRQLRAHESVDVFLADLQRLASIFGGMDDIGLGCAFVAGLPESAKHALQTGARMESLALSEIVDRARAILRRDDAVPEVAAALANQRPFRQMQPAHPAAVSSEPADIRSASVTCYACGQPNHLAMHCLRGGAGGRGRGGPRGAMAGSRRCFRCHRMGHVAACCPGNDVGEAA